MFRIKARTQTPQGFFMHPSYNLDLTALFFQATRFSIIRTRRICSSLCAAASSLAQIRLRTRLQVMVKSTSIRRTPHSGIVIFFSNSCIQDENGAFKNLCSTVGLPLEATSTKAQSPSSALAMGPVLVPSSAFPRSVVPHVPAIFLVLVTKPMIFLLSGRGSWGPRSIGVTFTFRLTFLGC